MQNTVSDIKEKNIDIKKLEKNIIEVHELF